MGGSNHGDLVHAHCQRHERTLTIAHVVGHSLLHAGVWVRRRRREPPLTEELLLSIGGIGTVLALASFRNWSGWIFLDPRSRSGLRSLRWRFYLLFLGV